MNSFLIDHQLSFQQIVKFTSPLSWMFPIPLLIDSIRKNDYRRIPLLQFPSFVVQQVCWITYGVKRQEFIIQVMSLCAFLLYLTYSMIYLKLTKQNLKILLLLIIVWIEGIVFQIFSKDEIGVIAAVAQMCSSFMNLHNITRSIKEKNGSYFNRCSLTIQLPNNICWVMLALELRDIILLIPNGLDTLMSSVQLILYLSLPHSKLKYIPLKIEKEDPNSISTDSPDKVSTSQQSTTLGNISLIHS